jgi:NADH pyrophosphatase NudC (nudix superfamily)
LQRGADILRKLDELAPQNVQSDKDAVVERALAARRKKNSSQKGGLTDDDIESMISARRRGRKEKSAGFCPKCGKPVMASDKFCPACGKALT